jgi:hypothetical protein
MTEDIYNKLQKIAQDLDPATGWGSYADKPKKAPIPQANVSKAPTAKQTARYLYICHR